MFHYRNVRLKEKKKKKRYSAHLSFIRDKTTNIQKIKIKLLINILVAYLFASFLIKICSQQILSTY